MEVKSGSVVKIHYTGSLEDGTIFDSSDGRDPIEFEVGKGVVIKGFDSGIVGMKKDEEKTLNIPFSEAYGPRNEELKQKVPRDKINLPGDIKPGMTLAVTAPDGQQFPVLVAGVEDDHILVDLNHPLAGKNLIFKVKIVDLK